MTSVHRLHKTKKALPKKVSDMWNALSEKLSEAQNFGQLRKAMDKQADRGEPLIPWFELLNKLRNWADNYNDYITQQSTKSKTPLLNFGKMYANSSFTLLVSTLFDLAGILWGNRFSPLIAIRR